MTLGDRIRQLRIEKDWSQKQLGEEVGLTRSQISNIENGKRFPSYKSQARLATALGVRVSDLTDEPHKEKIDEDEWLLFADKMKREGISLEEVQQWVKLARQFVGKERK